MSNEVPSLAPTIYKEEYKPQLDRMLRFHLSGGGHDFAIRAKHIRNFQRNLENKIKVLIVTDLMSPQGPMTYEVEESFDYCVELYTAALEGRAVNPTHNPGTRFRDGKILST